MKSFSVMDAAAEPFRLVGRRPLATLVWGLVILVPSFGVFAMMAPMWLEMMQAAAVDPAAAQTADPFDGDFAAMMQFQVWSNLLSLIQLFMTLFVTTAIVRAVLAQKRGDRWMFMRAGMDELRFAVAVLGVFVGLYALIVVAVLLAVGLGFALWSLPDPWRWIAYVVLGLGSILGFALLWGRLALIPPASIALGDFAFVEGWKMGRGHTWRLFGLSLVMLMIYLLIGAAFLVVFFVVIAIGAGSMAVVSDPQAIEAWFEGLGRQPGLLIGAGLVLLLPMAWLQGFSQALGTAPHAHVVAQLRPAPTPISPDTGAVAE